MIDAHAVRVHERASEPPLPPGKVVLGHQVPAVDGVAPELAGLAEIVRRHPGDDRRPASRVEQVELALRPDVAAVEVAVAVTAAVSVGAVGA